MGGRKKRLAQGQEDVRLTSVWDKVGTCSLSVHQLLPLSGYLLSCFLGQELNLDYKPGSR